MICTTKIANVTVTDNFSVINWDNDVRNLLPAVISYDKTMYNVLFVGVLSYFFTSCIGNTEVWRCKRKKYRDTWSHGEDRKNNLTAITRVALMMSILLVLHFSKQWEESILHNWVSEQLSLKHLPTVLTVRQDPGHNNRSFSFFGYNRNMLSSTLDSVMRC